jgi:hypothetical protein
MTAKETAAQVDAAENIRNGGITAAEAVQVFSQATESLAEYIRAGLAAGLSPDECGRLACLGWQGNTAASFVRNAIRDELTRIRREGEKVPA